MAEPETSAEREPVTITDRRRIDPTTGTVREGEQVQAPPQEQPAPEEGSPLAAAETQVVELTEDLQRVTAEYANFRKRVDRDRAGVVEAAKAAVLAQLLPVVDDLGRARGHGDLESSPLKSVADKLQQVLDEQGIAAFGEPGESFDPQLHEAVQHTGEGDVSVISAVYRQGYRFGERILRTAMVVVEDVPGTEPVDQGPSSDGPGPQQETVGEQSDDQ
ncbi:MAG: nucleotide exchange factor GrpE [Segniliparus sp.]|uniref:nucleotide exchange factor GrpE n=1 Tax=Segniliparus sp. TaxID=2804064 RepID=UPI003F2D0A65